MEDLQTLLINLSDKCTLLTESYHRLEDPYQKEIIQRELINIVMEIKRIKSTVDHLEGLN